MCRKNKTETKSPAETPTHQRGVLQFAAASSLPESFVFQPFEAAAAEAAARLKPAIRDEDAWSGGGSAHQRLFGRHRRRRCPPHD